jgi:hypothetical protein
MTASLHLLSCAQTFGNERETATIVSPSDAIISRIQHGQYTSYQQPPTMLLVHPTMQPAAANDAASLLPNCSRQHGTAAPASKVVAHIAPSNVSSRQQPPSMLLVCLSMQPAATIDAAGLLI